jgi:hypothetical protein
MLQEVQLTRQAAAADAGVLMAFVSGDGINPYQAITVSALTASQNSQPSGAPDSPYNTCQSYSSTWRV